MTKRARRGNQRNVVASSAAPARQHPNAPNHTAETDPDMSGLSQPAGDRRNIWLSLALVALTFLVFGQTSGCPFINYDDPGYVTENAEVIGGLTKHGLVWAFTNPHGGNWHPLTTLSHMLDCQLFGLSPAGPHIINILLHSAAAVLLFQVLRQMTGALWRSAFVAAVFAIHPLRVESVAWISERKDVLSGLMFMLVLMAYRRYTLAPSIGRYTAVAALFLLGLMSKPMLVTVPVVLLLVDYWPLRRLSGFSSAWKRTLEKVPLLIIAGAAAIGTIIAQARMHALESFEAMPMSWRVSNAVVSCVIYVRQMFWPAGLAVFYPHPEDRLPLLRIVIASVFLVLTTAAVVLLRRKRPYVLVGWLWYLLMLLPVIGILQVGLQAHADRYSYLPQIGLYVLVAWTIADISASWRRRRLVLATAAAASIVALAGVTMAQTAYWRDSETLWSRALAVTTDNDVAHANLSQVLLTSGRPQEALTHCEAAIEIRPDNATAYTNLGIALQQTGNVRAAIKAWNKSLQLSPGGFTPKAKLAWVFATAPDASLRNGRQAVALAEDANAATNYSNAVLIRTLAAAYAEAGRFDRAAEAAEKALEVANARGEASLAAQLEVDISNFRSNLRLRDQSLSAGTPQAI